MTTSRCARWGALALLFWVVPLAFGKDSKTATAPLNVAAREGLNATLWLQSAAEANIAARQAYRVATRQLDAALRDSNWSAALEQAKPFQSLPPAIILDIDETILDNSPYQARLVRAGGEYSGQSWGKWIAQADARALPGAVKFLREAQRMGVQIFYITNRSKAEEAATRLNLQRIGCPIQGPTDHVLMSGERPEWTSDKSSRRRFVARSHRVLLLVGDDLNDFVPAKTLTPAERLKLLERHNAWWGERWILLSNPLYGSWESALLPRQKLTRAQVLQFKYNALQPRESRAPVRRAAPAATR